MLDPIFRKLVETPSISGNESVFQRLVAKDLGSLSSVKFGDALDNYTVQVGNGPTKVLFSAHADEVGFIVTYIDDDGFISFQPVGGIDADVAVGQPVVINTKTGAVNGIVGREETWNTASSEETDEKTPFKDLWIDIGDTGRAKELVAIGDPVMFDFTLRELPPPYFMARGADDKLGVYIVLELVRRLAKKPNPALSLYAVTMSQEEIGSRGAPAAVNRIQPKYSLILDTISATDTPINDREEVGLMELGHGPILSRGSTTNQDLFFIMEEIAKREKIPYQVEASADPTITDADAVQITGLGSATMVIGIPVRYTHFPGEIFNWNDVKQTIVLLENFLQSLKEGS